MIDDPIEFAVSELLESHRILSQAGVPRRANGELLSVSQRVRILADNFGLLQGNEVAGKPLTPSDHLPVMDDEDTPLAESSALLSRLMKK